MHHWQRMANLQRVRMPHPLARLQLDALAAASSRPQRDHEPGAKQRERCHARRQQGEEVNVLSPCFLTMPCELHKKHDRRSASAASAADNKRLMMHPSVPRRGERDAAACLRNDGGVRAPQPCYGATRPDRAVRWPRTALETGAASTVEASVARQFAMPVSHTFDTFESPSVRLSRTSFFI